MGRYAGIILSLAATLEKNVKIGSKISEAANPNSATLGGSKLPMAWQLVWSVFFFRPTDQRLKNLVMEHMVIVGEW